MEYIINDLSLEEEELLYKAFPTTEYEFIKIALGKVCLEQSFFDENVVYGICKSNQNIEALQKLEIPVLGYESTEGKWLKSAYVTQDLSVINIGDLKTVYARAKGLPLTILETKDFLIREHTEDDFEGIKLLYANDEEMVKYMEPLFPDEEEREYQRKYIEVIYKFYGYGVWVIEDKATKEIVGRAGIETKENCKTLGEVELAYQIRKDYRNKGVATLVVREIINYTFDTLKKSKIIARVDEENIPSVKLLKKLGFSKQKGLYVLKNKAE